MRLGRKLALLVGSAVSLSGCQNVVLGAPQFPPCYLDSEVREAEVDGLKNRYPASYEWIRRMDALCVAWEEE